jgi:hypothetical protein
MNTRARVALYTLFEFMLAGEFPVWGLPLLLLPILKFLFLVQNDSRHFLRPLEEKGIRELSLDDIRIDAEKVRPYDHVWDMYYDEFEDVEVGSQV